MNIFLSIKKNVNKRAEIILVNLVILSFLLRFALPFLKFLFLFLYAITIIWVIIFYYNVLIDNLKQIITKYTLIYILTGILVLSFIFSDKIYLSVELEILNLLILLSFFYILSILISDKTELNYLLLNQKNLIIIFALAISIFQIVRLFDLFSFNESILNKILFFAFLKDNTAEDNNFAQIPIIFASILVFHRFTNPLSKYKFLIFNSLIILFTINLFFSGSRRAIIILILLLFLVLFIRFFLFHNSDSSVKAFKNNIDHFLIILSLFIILCLYFIFYTSLGFKQRFFKSFDIENGGVNSDKAIKRVFRYFVSVDKNTDYRKFYDKIWENNIDPKDPDTGWGTRIHKTVYPLSGVNAQILPKGVKGYQMDSSCNATTWSGNAYSYTSIWNNKIKKGCRMFSSVYCLVSKDYDGNWVKIVSEGTSYGKTEEEYDLRKKGEWQELKISPICYTGNVRVNLFFSKFNCTDFSSLKGYVIFAFPQLKFDTTRVNIDPKDPESGWGTKNHKTIFPLTGNNHEIVPKDSKGYFLDSTCNVETWGGNAHSLTEVGRSKTNKNCKINFSVYCYLSNEFNGNAVGSLIVNEKYPDSFAYYDTSKKGTWQKLTNVVERDTNLNRFFLTFSQLNTVNFSNLKGYIIFAHPEYYVTNIEDTSSFNSDILRNNSELNFRMENMLADTLSFTRFQYSFLDNKFMFNSKASPERNSRMNQLVIPDYIKIKSKKTYLNINPFNHFGSKFIRYDTTYHPYTANIELKPISNRFLDLRTIRWQFALQIFKKEYNYKQKLFGGGFNFLNWFGYLFYHDKTRSDYPHNPFLHILLYSGIFGLLLYLFFLYKVFCYYIKYFKEYPFLFIFFLITFFFAFFSSGNPFDPPIMGFFVILPFFIHSIYENEAKSITKVKIEE